MSSDMSTVESESNQYTHARFWRCALQVNPAGYSEAYRGQGHGLSGQDYLSAVLRICQEEGIKVVGLADHGSVTDVDAIREYLSPHGIVVFPGFEVATTEKVHWVCLFPEDTGTAQLNRFLGALAITDPEDGVKPSNLGGDALLSKVEEFGGICYAAHITGKSGLLKERKPHLWSSPRLKAAQIPGPIEDLPPEYRPIVLNANPHYRRDRPLALINAKDVAVPEDLRAPNASCYIKMTRPCFESFQMAFKDPESRIRLHHEMRERYYSRIERVSVDGGYLHGLEVHLSEHLNTVIGGRGTGKSTLLESLRYALGRDHKGSDAKRQGEQVLKENLGKAHSQVRVELVSAKQNMNRYTVVRRYGEPPRVVDAEGDESSLQPSDLLPGMEVYGQNEIYELAKDEGALILVLGRFLPDQLEHERQLAGLHKRLHENAGRLVEAQAQWEELQDKLAKLPKLQEQVEQFKALGLEEKLEQVPLLEKERHLRPRLQEELDRVQRALGGFRDSLPELTFLSDKALEGLPHADRLRDGRQVLEKAKALIEHHSAAIEKVIVAASKDVAELVSELERLQKGMVDRLDKEFAKLPEVAGKSGKEVGRTYQSLLRQMEAIRPQESQVEAVDKRLKTLRQERRNLLGDLSDLRNACSGQVISDTSIGVSAVHFRS
ncbi:AAA family ATPase [Thioalkalivibrio sp. ALgr1]|uniref:AAA family ATPase n=1 Tax=Thioalkalivibrio sp. ALgr1 TaxID=748655 RepID=UPI0018DDE18B|nr:AAA family ATPase [Thioalkalivibrio sp. ALgr1]